jgi:carbon-monoxide dehydrogenase medium subunit
VAFTGTVVLGGAHRGVGEVLAGALVLGVVVLGVVVLGVVVVVAVLELVLHAARASASSAAAAVRARWIGIDSHATGGSGRRAVSRSARLRSMKMAAFEHHRPTSLAEALQLLAEHGPDAKVVAGGQSLVPMLAMRLATPAHLVDITRVAGLDGIRATDAAMDIGALVRHAAAEASPVVAERTPLLARAVPWIGHRAIRNRGTVCGSLAHADPAAELPAVALALGATFVLQSIRGERQVPAAEFFQGYLSTCAAEDELLTAVRFPCVGGVTGSAVLELSRRHGDFAIAGVACELAFGADGNVDDAALAFFGVADTPVRVGAAEALLRGRPPTPRSFAEAAAAVSAAVRPSDDVHASAAYRRHVAGVLARRALVAAAADAGIVMEDAA